MNKNEDVKFVLCAKSGKSYVTYEYIRTKSRSKKYVHNEDSSSYFKENIMTMKPLRLILINISER